MRKEILSIMNNASNDLNDWDCLYSNGMQGEFPSEMLIRFVNSKLKNRPGLKVLDLGCGTGRHLAYFIEKNYHAYGIEGSGKAIEIAKKWLIKKGLKAEIKHGSVLDKNLYERNLDAVVDIACMQHNIFSDIEIIVSNVHESLVEDGYFFTMMKNRDDSLYKQGERIDRSTYKFSSGLEKVTASLLITFPSLEEVTELFSHFSDVEIEKEEWTFNNRDKKVSHWVVTARK